MRILVLCTGNSCRSQIAEAFLKSFDANMEVYSAGTIPTERVNPYAIRIMNEIGLDLHNNKPKNVEEFLNQEFDYVITVCDEANESCPMFSGKVKNRIHIGSEDPADAKGSDEEIMSVFRKIREQIKEGFYKFYKSINV